jgi:RNA polymerase sigma-70 factor (ECF subfamily)
MADKTPPDLNRFRSELRLLAEIGLSPRLRVKEDPSDIVQQTLLDAHRDLPAYRGQTDAELLAWLRTILTHKLLNAVRRHTTLKNDHRREQAIFDQLEQSSLRIDAFLASEQTSPSQRAVRNEQLEQLADGLAKLLDGERTAIVLKNFQGWTVSQISEHLGRTPDAVTGLLRRGLQKLRSHLPSDSE